MDFLAWRDDADGLVYHRTNIHLSLWMIQRKTLKALKSQSQTHLFNLMQDYNSKQRLQNRNNSKHQSWKNTQTRRGSVSLLWLCARLACSKGMWSEIIELFCFHPVSVLRRTGLRHIANKMLIQPSWPRRLPLFVFLCYLIYSDFYPRKIPHNSSETCIKKGGYNSKLLLERQNEGMWRSLLLLLSITHKIKYSCHGLSSLGRKVKQPRKHKNTSSFSMGLSFQPRTLTVTFRLHWVGCWSQSFRFNTNTHTHKCCASSVWLKPHEKHIHSGAHSTLKEIHPTPATLQLLNRRPWFFSSKLSLFSLIINASSLREECCVIALVGKVVWTNGLPSM